MGRLSWRLKNLLACHIHECNHHEEHYYQRIFLESWMSVKDPNAGNYHVVIPKVYMCLGTQILSTALATFQF